MVHQEASDAPLAEYRAVSGLAVAGLAVGLLSATAMIAKPCWVLPPLGIVLSAMALRRIRRDAPALIGRTAAVAGLLLSATFAAAAPADWLAYRWLLGREARQFGAIWIDALTQGQIRKAHQLTLDPRARQPLEEDDSALHGDSSRWSNDLKKYAEQQPVKALLALGTKAEVRLERTIDRGGEGNRDWIELLYAVDGDEDGAERRFSIGLLVERIKFNDGRANWRVVRSEGG